MVYEEVVVDNFNDYNYIISDYLAKGFSLICLDDKTVVLKKNNYGSFKIHLLLFVFTFWWLFGLSNLIYLLYSYLNHSKGCKIMYDNKNDITFNDNSEYNYVFKNNQYIENYLMDDDGIEVESGEDYVDESISPIVKFLED